MQIKPFSAAHIDAVCAIEAQCFAQPWSRADLARQLTLPTSHFLVAEVGGKAVGYLGLQIFSGEGYVTNLAVLPAYRRQGLAKALLAAALARTDMDFLTLEVRKSNGAAIALYTQFGFETVGTRPRFYTAPVEDAVLMTYYFTEKQ